MSLLEKFLAFLLQTTLIVLVAAALAHRSGYDLQAFIQGRLEKTNTAESEAKDAQITDSDSTAPVPIQSSPLKTAP